MQGPELYEKVREIGADIARTMLQQAQEDSQRASGRDASDEEKMIARAVGYGIYLAADIAGNLHRIAHRDLD